MAPRTVDVVAAGPPSADLYDPAAPAWALAAGLAACGHSVHVVYPGSTDAAVGVPSGVSTAAFPPVTSHVGSAVGDAELTRAAARHLRPDAQVVVRDPAGLGSLGHHVAHRSVVSFVRTLEKETGGPELLPPKLAGLSSRLRGWGGHRGVRRLEKEALEDATAICCATVAHRDRLRTEYGIPSARLRVVPPAVRAGPDGPNRQAARRAVTIPDDVPLAIALPPVDPQNVAAVGPAVEAIRRARPIFAGARLVVLGVPAVGPGVSVVPGRDTAAVTTAAAAADVAIASEPGVDFDPGVAAALRAGLPTIVGPAFDLGEGSDGAVRRLGGTDPGELASVLAELFADPEERRALGERARAFARRYEPERLAAELESAGALGAR